MSALGDSRGVLVPAYVRGVIEWEGDEAPVYQPGRDGRWEYMEEALVALEEFECAGCRFAGEVDPEFPSSCGHVAVLNLYSMEEVPEIRDYGTHLQCTAREVVEP
jgi:hypothetical protein